MGGQGRFIINNGILIQFLGGADDVIIPDGVIEIGAGAFRSYDVKTVHIPDGVVAIGDNCFTNCKQLKKIRIPASVKTISDSAFCNTVGVRVDAAKGTYAWEYVQKKSNLVIDSIVVNTDKGTPTAMPLSSNSTFQPMPEKRDFVKQSVSVTVDKSQNTAIPNSGNAKPQLNMGKQSVSQQPSSNVKKDPQITVQKDPLEELLERQSEKLAARNKELEYARILGCNVGERPWTMRNNFFGRADRFARRVQNIFDQELLMRIASEAQVTSIICAAVRNIKAQDVLIKYARHSSYEVRLSAIRNLQDQATLINLATTDNWHYVRDAAIKKVNDSKTIKKYLMETRKSDVCAELNKISAIQDLLDLAISADCDSVREQATSRLPSNLPETQFLKAAVEVSKKIEPYAVERMENAVEKLKQANPNFLNTVAVRYPFPGVRYLARSRGGIKPKDTHDMEEFLSSITPSQYEIYLQEKIDHCIYLLDEARRFVNRFCCVCETEANRGVRSNKMSYGYDIDTYSEASLVKELLSTELSRKGFTGVSFEISTEWVEFQNRTNYVINVYASW